MTNLPRLIEPDELEAHLDKDNLIIVDLCNPSLHQHKHVPGAVHLSVKAILSFCRSGLEQSCRAWLGARPSSPW